MRLPYKKLEAIAKAHNCSFERGKEADGTPYVRMGGFLGPLQSAAREAAEIPLTRGGENQKGCVHHEQGDDGFYFYAW